MFVKRKKLPFFHLSIDMLPLASLWSEKKEDKKKREDNSKKGELDHWITHFGGEPTENKIIQILYY